MELRLIYDGAVSASGRNISQTFVGGQFLYFDPQAGEGISMEIGVALLIKLPGIGGDLLKIWEDRGFLDTNNLIPIPREVSEAGYELYIALGVAADVPSFRAYVIYSTVTQESLSQQITDLQTEVTTLLENQTTAFNLQLALAGNALVQNAALSIVATGLIPITGGVSGTAVPVLASNPLLALPFL